MYILRNISIYMYILRNISNIVLFLNTYNEIVPLNRRRITPGSIYWVFHVHKTIREKDTTTGRSTLLPRFDDIIPFNIGFSPVDWPTDIYN